MAYKLRYNVTLYVSDFQKLRIFAKAIPTTSAIALIQISLADGLTVHQLHAAVYSILVTTILVEWALRSTRRRLVV